MYSLLLDGYDAETVSGICINPFRKVRSDEITLNGDFTIKVSEIKGLFKDRSLALSLSYYHKFKVFGLQAPFWTVSNKLIETLIFLESMYTEYQAEKLK